MIFLFLHFYSKTVVGIPLPSYFLRIRMRRIYIVSICFYSHYINNENTQIVIANVRNII